MRPVAVHLLGDGFDLEHLVTTVTEPLPYRVAAVALR